MYLETSEFKLHLKSRSPHSVEGHVIETSCHPLRNLGTLFPLISKWQQKLFQTRTFRRKAKIAHLSIWQLIKCKIGLEGVFSNLLESVWHCTRYFLWTCAQNWMALKHHWLNIFSWRPYNAVRIFLRERLYLGKEVAVMLLTKELTLCQSHHMTQTRGQWWQQSVTIWRQQSTQLQVWLDCLNVSRRCGQFTRRVPNLDQQTPRFSSVITSSQITSRNTRNVGSRWQSVPFLPELLLGNPAMRTSLCWPGLGPWEGRGKATWGHPCSELPHTWRFSRLIFHI